MSAEGDIKSSRAACDKSDTRDSKQTTDDQLCHAAVHFTAVSGKEHQQLVSADSVRVNCADRLNSHHHPLKLPEFEHFLRPSSIQPITELGGSAPASDADQLETERADFRDIPARFQQNVTWSSAAVTMSSSTLSEDESVYKNTATRDCRRYSQHDKPPDVKHSCITDNRQSTGDGHSLTACVCPVVSTSSSEPLTSSSSRLTDNSSRLLQQVTLLSQQLSAQVIYTNT